MGSPGTLLISALFLLISLFSAPLAAQHPFSCSGTAVCDALVGYKNPSATTLRSIGRLFSVKNHRTLLGANNLPLSTPPTSPVPANQTLKIPFPCICRNGTGVSNRRPVYKMVAGDDLSHIADVVFSGLLKFQQIQEVNNISDADLIRLPVGKELWIPLPCSCNEVGGERVVHYGHLVEPGSSVEGIAQEFNTAADTLLQVNGLANASQLLAGVAFDVPLRACSSVIANTSLDYPLLLPNGTYSFTATNCVRCHCDAANNYVLQCEPSGINSSSWQSCPSMLCPGEDNLSLGNSASVSCNSRRCAYAGYSNQTVLTTIVQDSTCPGSDNNNNGASMVGLQGWRQKFLLSLVLLCLHLFP